MFEPGNPGRRKLSNEQVREIKERYAEGEGSYGSLAREYGVATETVARIIRGESRANVVTAAEMRAREAKRVSEEKIYVEEQSIKFMRMIEQHAAEMGVKKPCPDPFDHDLPAEPDAEAVLEKLEKAISKEKASDKLVEELGHEE